MVVYIAIVYCGVYLFWHTWWIYTKDNPVEMHFHDEDETWVIQQGEESQFSLEAGDIWMIEAGVQHACEPGEQGCTIFPFYGTIPEGSHEPGHYYMEKEKYMPTLVLKKLPQ